VRPASSNISFQKPDKLSPNFSGTFRNIEEGDTGRKQESPTFPRARENNQGSEESIRPKPTRGGGVYEFTVENQISFITKKRLLYHEATPDNYPL
jgi:hypothetical protein